MEKSTTGIGAGIKRARELFNDGRGMTLREVSERVAKKVGKPVSHSVLFMYEANKVKVKPFMLKAIAEVLDTTVAKIEELAGVHAGETAPIGRKAPVTGNGIPVINAAPAGRFVDYDHVHYDEQRTAHEYLPRGGIDDELAFALVVVGDSMEPSLKEGDHIIVGPVRSAGDERERYRVSDGECVLVRMGPDAKDQGVTVGRYFHKSERAFELRKDNKKYKPIQVDRQKVTQFGVILEMRRKKP